MRKQVELLEDHSGTHSDLTNLLAPGTKVGADFEPDPIYLDRSAGRLLEKVDTSQKRALSGAGPSEDHDYFGGNDAKRDLFEDVMVAKVFVELVDANDVSGHNYS
jgi:hypothetical protein